MRTRLNPYINFKDTARQAMEFYRSVFGGNLVINTFGEMQKTGNEVEDNKIMHSMLETDNGFFLMASDAPPGMELTTGSSINIIISGDDFTEIKSYWDKLSQGANITVPLAVSPWGDQFGMLTDQFGISWLVNCAEKKD